MLDNLIDTTDIRNCIPNEILSIQGLSFDCVSTDDRQIKLMTEPNVKTLPSFVAEGRHSSRSAKAADYICLIYRQEDLALTTEQLMTLGENALELPKGDLFQAAITSAHFDLAIHLYNSASEDEKNELVYSAHHIFPLSCTILHKTNLTTQNQYKLTKWLLNDVLSTDAWEANEFPHPSGEVDTETKMIVRACNNSYESNNMLLTQYLFDHLTKIAKEALPYSFANILKKALISQDDEFVKSILSAFPLQINYESFIIVISDYDDDNQTTKKIWLTLNKFIDNTISDLTTQRLNESEDAQDKIDFEKNDNQSRIHRALQGYAVLYFLIKYHDNSNVDGVEDKVSKLLACPDVKELVRFGATNTDIPEGARFQPEPNYLLRLAAPISNPNIATKLMSIREVYIKMTSTISPESQYLKERETKKAYEAISRAKKSNHKFFKILPPEIIKEIARADVPYNWYVTRSFSKG